MRWGWEYDLGLYSEGFYKINSTFSPNAYDADSVILIQQITFWEANLLLAALMVNIELYS